MNDSLVPLVAAAIGAAAALSGQLLNLTVSQRRQRANCLRALEIEMSAIARLLQESLAASDGATFIRYSALGSPIEMSRVYSGSIANIGSLRRATASQIVEFYSAFLTLKVTEGQVYDRALVASVYRLLAGTDIMSIGNEKVTE